MLYFKKELVEQAIKIIENHSSYDKSKTIHYLNEINKILNQFDSLKPYNSISAQILDSNIRKDYPYCDKLDNYHLPKSNSNNNNNKNNVYVPEEIRRLNVDKYGIIYTELFNEGIVKSIDDFIDESK